MPTFEVRPGDENNEITVQFEDLQKPLDIKLYKNGAEGVEGVNIVGISIRMSLSDYSGMKNIM